MFTLITSPNKFIASSFPMIIDNVWKFTGVSGKVANINVSSKLESDKNTENIIVNDVELKYNITGNQTGKLKIDKDTGWIIESEIQQNLKGKMILTNEFMPDGMTIPITIKSKTTTRKL